MSALQPMAVYALKVDPGEELVAAMPHFASMFRITMAAIDPSEDPDAVELDQSTMTQRSTLKLIRFSDDLFDEDDDSDDEDYDEDDLMDDDDDEDEDEDDEVNGGPSNKKSKKQALLEALAADEAEDEDMSDADDDDEDSEGDEAEALASLKALIKSKGKEKAVDGEDDDDSEIESDEGIDLDDMTEMAICTLDTKAHYQQPLDLTIQENEKVFFRVVGSHPVYITGNYVIPPDYANGALLDDEDSDEEGQLDEYDLSPDEDELDGLDALVNGESESDELDDIDDPRVTEVESEEEVPKLIKNESSKVKKEDKSSGKGKNKRPAQDSDDEDEPALDDIMAKSLKKEDAKAAAIKHEQLAAPAVNGESKKLSKAEKKQLKKLKKNDGTAADVAPPSSATLDGNKETAPEKEKEKKVQFDKNLVKGPTPNGDSKPGAAAPAAATTTSKSVSVREVSGVTIDERKVGNGPAAKKGSKLDMRYIGKLDSGAVFDSNKSGKPFSLKLGVGEVIKGWDIGLEGIKAGGERRLVIPANLAYGKKGMPGIPANSRLTFDIKCLGVK